MKSRLLLALALVVAGAACRRIERLQLTPPTALRHHYLLDYEVVNDPATGFATMGHLLVFNPGERAATLDVTAYYEDADPRSFALSAPAGISSEWNFTTFPAPKSGRFALEVAASEPVVCQATVGWNNTGNDYRPVETAHPHRRARETAKSYMSITTLARRWYLADGIVLNAPGALYIRESEWALILNPGARPAKVTLTMFGARTSSEHTVDVPPQRLRSVFMDELVRPNRHYGVRFASDVPVAVQWVRSVNWYNSDELMAFWSVPCVPLDPLESGAETSH